LSAISGCENKSQEPKGRHLGGSLMNIKATAALKSCTLWQSTNAGLRTNLAFPRTRADIDALVAAMVVVEVRRRRERSARWCRDANDRR
jgi:hypothetical protein